MRKLFPLACCLLLASVVAFSDRNEAHAQSGGSCTTEMFDRDNVGRNEVDIYDMKQVDGKVAFVPRGTVKKDELPEHSQVMACGAYAQLKYDGKTLYIKRTAYRVPCSCGSGQKRDASVPGAGDVKQCPADQCPAN